MSGDPLVEAVHHGDVFAIATQRAEAGDGPDELPSRILACGARIAADLAAACDEIGATLDAAGVGYQAPTLPHRAQRHALTVRVGDVATAHRAAAALEAEGFERWDRWQAGAAVSFDRTADHLRLGRTRDQTLVVRVEWDAPRTRCGAIDRLLRPSHGDWAMVTLPRALWWAYPGVRVVRLAAERLGLRARHRESIGPFLATPDQLLEPLLDVAGATATDVVVDLGCGDGRLVVAAATRGGRSVGVELDPDLADRARSRASEAGLADRVTIVTGDARTIDLDDADIVFAFLPTDVLADLLPSVLAALRPGARVVAHEQNRLAPSTPRPTVSQVVVADAALTVAHRWDA